MLQRLKHLVVILLLVGFVFQPALAEGLNQDDMAFAFGDSAMNSDLGEMALLSDQEMLKTEGEWLGYVVKYGGKVLRNTRIDGYNGSRIFQVRWKKRPVYRLDYKANPSPSKLHMHFGNMKHHRPWYAPWKRH